MGNTEKSFVETLKELFKTIFYALLIAGLIRTLLFQPFWIPSGSMKPNLLIGDYIFVNKFVCVSTQILRNGKIISGGSRKWVQLTAVCMLVFSS